MEKFFEMIKKKINRLLKSGSQIRFPGGTSKSGRKNSIGILSLIDYHKILLLLVVPYELYVKKYKDSFFEEIDDDDEDPIILLIIKIKEETGYDLIYENIEDPILIFSIPDNRPGLEKEIHTKYFFLTDKFSGQLIDLSNSAQLNRETSTPFWVPVILLPRFIFIKHLKALERAVDTLFRRLQLDEHDYRLIKKEISLRMSLENKNRKRNKITRRQ